MRRPAAVCALLLLGCAHEGIGEADARLRERDYDRALRGYRAVAARVCPPGKDHDPATCCRAMAGEGEALLELGERQRALDVLGRAREECPRDPELRRRLYLARHASAPDPTGAPVTLTFALEHEVQALTDKVKLTWVGVFVDGELVGREPHQLAPGDHELEADAFVEARGGAAVRLGARQTLSVSRGGAGAGRVRLTFGERPASRLEDRLTLDVEALTRAPVEAPDADAQAAEALVKQHLGLELRVAGAAWRLPSEAKHGGTLPAEVCVAPDGRVRAVRFTAPTPAHDPRVDAAVIDAVRRWRYGGYRVNGVLRGFCHPLPIDLGAPPP